MLRSTVTLALSNLVNNSGSSGMATADDLAKFDAIDRSAEETHYIATGNVLAGFGSAFWSKRTGDVFTDSNRGDSPQHSVATVVLS